MAHFQLYRYPFQAMGCPCEIQLEATARAQAEYAAQRVIADVRRLEQRYSRYRPDSLLSEINRVAATGGVLEVDEETAGLLNYAATCFAQSDGLFDITSGILRQVWRLDRQALPEAREIQALLAKIGWHKLCWNPPRLEFPVPGMELDLGGVVKEYAVDRAVTLCWEAGVQHGLINLGGDIRIVGPRADGTPWRIGIRHPRRQGALLDSVALYRGALASSGDYERCLVIGETRYGHVLNPKTGWPVQHLAAVSVVGEFCIVAGSASTIAMLKERQGPEWLESLGMDHLYVTVEGEAGGPLLDRMDKAT
ncbi:FAD:protein FMN transferase [Candidatus Methylocalor cossyra]|uniref:FAD:protein FMN transferase n=1 Tax=Candidatus Methylocalor cossyra TaxID=3108543 RepID=A0ABP1CAQ8_9GAMM